MKYYKCWPNISEFNELTVKGYEKNTDKKFPFYQVINGEEKYYAVCPGCENTIRIINLYSDKKIKEDGKPQTLHGRHHPYDVKGFLPYDEKKYNSCPFSKPINFGGKTMRGSDIVAWELKDIIMGHTDLLLNSARDICGINISDNMYKRMLQRFCDSKGIFYRYVNKFNLPYSFLYMSQNQNIEYQFISGRSKLEKELKETINEKCNFFEVNKYGQIRPTHKHEKNKPSLYMYFTDHKIVQGENEPTQHMTMVIKEAVRGNKETIMESKITFNPYLFYNTINKTNRLKSLAKSIFS